MVRQSWRESQWVALASERPDFAGIERGIDRACTLSLFKKWSKHAKGFQSIIDELQLEQAAVAGEEYDHRALLGVLRLLLCGGLLSPDKVSRHLNGARSECPCAVGGYMSVEHISWECELYAEKRLPIQHLLGWVQEQPRCFRYALLVPQQMEVSRNTVELLQRVVCEIWQLHIRAFLAQEEKSKFAAMEEKDKAKDNAGIEEAGHLLRVHKGGSLFCCRCGKSTKIHAHKKLKITGKRCEFAGNGPELWVDEPGIHGKARDLKQWAKVLEHYNDGGHCLIWNGKAGLKAGQADFGMIWCTRCGRQFAWRDRCCNIKGSQCVASRGNEPLTPKVRLMEKTAVPKIRSGEQISLGEFPEVHRRWRMRGTTTPLVPCPRWQRQKSKEEALPVVPVTHHGASSSTSAYMVPSTTCSNLHCPTCRCWPCVCDVAPTGVQGQKLPKSGIG